MKDFLRQQLDRLHLIGIRQVDYLSKEDVETLLNELEKVTKKFSYIPEARQMAEIEKQLVEDLDAKDGLTLRNVWKWMYKISPLYWNATRMSEEELTPPPPPVDDERRDYWLNIWKLTLSQIENRFPTHRGGSGSRLKESLGIQKAESVGVVKNYDVGETCPDCKGFGTTEEIKILREEVVCKTCNGTGQINTVSIPATSEAEARKTFIELFGVKQTNP